MPIKEVVMRFAARRAPSVESVQTTLDRLARERQDLRARQAGTDVLEQNRLAIVAAQWELSRALIRLHLPHLPPIERAA